MEQEQAEKIVRDAIKEQLDKTDVNLSDKWRDIGADSLDLVELLMIAEESVGKPLNEKELGEVHTVGDMVELLKRSM